MFIFRYVSHFSRAEQDTRAQHTNTLTQLERENDEQNYENEIKQSNFIALKYIKRNDYLTTYN